MKKRANTLFAALLLLPPLAHAGVVMDMVTRNASGKETERAKIHAQSNRIRMDEVDGTEVRNSMIFLGDKFLYLDHRDQSYIVMDEAMLDEVSGKISDAMKEMEAQLAAMPPEQRAMVEQMMKGQMQGMMGKQGAPRPAPTVESMGRGKWQSYSCDNYAVFDGGKKTQQVCAADLDDIDGADEVMKAFRSMAAYITKMTESMPMMSGQGLNPGELMNQIDGFPVHTIDYEDGEMLRETSLDSVAEKDLEPGLFAAPKGYRQQDMFSGR